jgi:predicted ester cyclase
MEVAMVAETNKEIVRRYYDAGHHNDLGAWDTVCSPDMVLDVGFIPPIHGLEGVRQFTAGMHSAFSDFFLSVDDSIAEEDRVAVRWTEGGTHSGPLVSPDGAVIPPTGKQVALTGISLLRVANGKITEERVQADILGFMQQLGVVPPPG